jgi:subtilisin family serine protease
MAVKILDANGEGSAADAVPAIYYAVANGADIISGSWGGTETSNALRDAIAYAHDQGVIVVAAAGNNASDTPYFPAAYPEVISVAATDASDHRWYLSNYGDWVDIAAPGQGIISLLATLPGKPVREGAISTRSGPQWRPRMCRGPVHCSWPPIRCCAATKWRRSSPPRETPSQRGPALPMPG